MTDNMTQNIELPCIDNSMILFNPSCKDAHIKKLESEVAMYKDLLRTTFTEIKLDDDIIESKHDNYSIFDKDNEALIKLHIINIKNMFSKDYFTKCHNRIALHVKPHYKTRLLIDLIKYKIVACGLNIVNNLLCAIYVNIYGDCFGYLGLMEYAERHTIIFKYYPMPNMTLELNPEREIMSMEYCAKIIKDKSIYFLATNAFLNVYTNIYTPAKKSLHNKPPFFGSKDANFFGSVKLLNLWMLQKKRLFIKFQTEMIITAHIDTNNEFTEDELSIIQENILFELKIFHFILNSNKFNILINYQELTKILNEFKIIGFYYKKDNKMTGYVSSSSLKSPLSLLLSKSTPVVYESYNFDKISINYIDIYGNSYNSQFNTVKQPTYENPSGLYNYGRHLYLIPFIKPPREAVFNDISNAVLFKLIQSKKYINTQNIYQEFLIENLIEDGKKELLPELINYIKLKLENNDDFIIFYTYVANQIISKIKFLSIFNMLQQTIKYFEKSLRYYKLELFDYASNKAIGLADPSYIQFCK